MLQLDKEECKKKKKKTKVTGFMDSILEESHFVNL